MRYPTIRTLTLRTVSAPSALVAVVQHTTTPPPSPPFLFVGFSLLLAACDRLAAVSERRPDASTVGPI